MADVKMPDSKPCQFGKGGWAPCKKLTDNGWCTKHEKAKCVSCGEHAVRSCDAQMGGLGCGENLCGSCQHIENSHVKQEVAKKYWAERERLEKEGVESERMLAERGLSPDPKRPHHLKELLARGKKGYEMKEIFSLEIEHSSMGYFPAIFADMKKRIVITTDAALMFRIWGMLEPRESKLNVNDAWVNEELGICYAIPRQKDEYWLKESRPERLHTLAEHDELVKDEGKPYKWAFGLIGTRDPGPFEFIRNIKKMAKERGITLASTP